LLSDRLEVLFQVAHATTIHVIITSDTATTITAINHPGNLESTELLLTPKISFVVDEMEAGTEFELVSTESVKIVVDIVVGEIAVLSPETGVIEDEYTVGFVEIVRIVGLVVDVVVVVDSVGFVSVRNIELVVVVKVVGVELVVVRGVAVVVVVVDVVVVDVVFNVVVGCVVVEIVGVVVGLVVVVDVVAGVVVVDVVVVDVVVGFIVVVDVVVVVVEVVGLLYIEPPTHAPLTKDCPAGQSISKHNP
jgi:hypothetical protein